MCRRSFPMVSLVLLVGLLLSSTAGAADGLIGWWKFDEGSGTTAKDSSGLGNDGMFGTEGTPQWVAGIHGGADFAVYLDGSDDYVNIDAIANYMPASNNFTVSAWIKTTTGDGNVIACNDTGSGHDFILGVASNGTMLVEADNSRNYPPVINDDQWHMITYVRDGSTAYVYTDGEQVGTETPSGNPGAQPRWSIGQEWDSSPSDEYQGIVDEVRFYDIPLSASAVTDLYKETKPIVLKAIKPDPADGAAGITMPVFSWTVGDTAVFHNVYFGTSPALTEADLASQNQPFPMYFHVPGVEPGVTYYWRVDEIDAAGAITAGDVWSFSTASLKAYDAFPKNGAKFTPTDVELTWTPGYGMILHTVYFGTSFDEVKDASGGTAQATTTYTPASPLAQTKTYYWRVDESDGTTTEKGDVWTFTTIGDIEVTDPDLIGWWTFDEGGITTALDFSGLGNDATFGGGVTVVEGIVGNGIQLNAGYVAIDGIVDDLKGTNLTLSAWIKTTQSGEGNLFAANDSDSSYALLFGVQGGNPYRWDGSDQQFPPAVNDDQWHLLTYVRDGATGYIYVDGTLRTTYSASFSLSNITRWSIGQEWDGSTPSDFYNGLVDDVRVYSRPLTADEVQDLMRVDLTLAWKPNPGTGATVDVIQAEEGLTWSTGDGVTQHDVYFGLDQAAVKDATASDTTGVYRGRQAQASYIPAEPLGWGTGPYYWRIDEVQDDGTIGVGAVWSVSIADFLSVDDMESYTDQEGEEIFTIWVDGYTDGLSGSTVGLMVAVGGTFGETTIVHDGRQSMPLVYNNSQTPYYSEATQTFAPLQDWTAYGVDTLTLFWQGDATNGADKVYVVVEDSAGKRAVVTNADPAAAQAPTWMEWRIPLSDLSGANLAKVEKLYVGVGNRTAPTAGGAGTIYVDDIRLTKPPEAVSGPIDLRISDGGDDAEEHLDDGDMDIGSSDLEFPYEDSGSPSSTDAQVTALRFSSVPIAKGATIANAYLELEVDETKGGSQPVNVIIEAQLVAHAPGIADVAGNLSGRAPLTTAKVKWSVPNWTATSAKFQSPDLSAVIQEIVNQEGWASGNALLLIIRDDPDNPSTGLRCAESVEGEAAAAPLLHIEIAP